ncbi:MAG: hypothetical protein V1784_11905 [bacterium]
MELSPKISKEDEVGSPTSSKPKNWSRKPLFFSESKVGDPSLRYICWLDVMGTKSTMLWSIKMVSNFVMKLHVAALEERPPFPEVELFPVIDGIYLCTVNQRQLLDLLKNIFVRLVVSFIVQADPFYRFMVRGALAYCPVLKGEGLKKGSDILHSNENECYCDSMLLGMPLSQTYEAAREAAPFGLYVHESARAFAPVDTEVIPYIHWKWWKHSRFSEPGLIEELKEKLKEHFAWCESHPKTILYDSKSIERHAALAKEYFEWDDRQLRKQVS